MQDEYDKFKHGEFDIKDVSHILPEIALSSKQAHTVLHSHYCFDDANEDDVDQITGHITLHIKSYKITCTDDQYIDVWLGADHIRCYTKDEFLERVLYPARVQEHLNTISKNSQ